MWIWLSKTLAWNLGMTKSIFVNLLFHSEGVCVWHLWNANCSYFFVCIHTWGWEWKRVCVCVHTSLHDVALCCKGFFLLCIILFIHYCFFFSHHTIFLTKLVICTLISLKGLSASVEKQNSTSLVKGHMFHAER